MFSLFLFFFSSYFFSAIGDITYEKICVYFNIAATLTQKASIQKETVEGIKEAINSLRIAAGWFERIRNIIKVSTFNPHQVDLTDLSLLFFKNFCLAQAQEQFFYLV